MKRVIKFRAWDGEEMHLPEYSDKEDFHILPDGTIVETHEYGYERHELTSRRGDDWLLMQFTGMKDKNGKEIYEGDIVKTNYNVHGKPIEPTFNSFISYNEHVGTWQIAYKNISDAFVTDDIGFRYFLEVVGNIYENPELIQANGKREY